MTTQRIWLMICLSPKPFLRSIQRSYTRLKISVAIPWTQTWTTTKNQLVKWLSTDVHVYVCFQLKFGIGKLLSNLSQLYRTRCDALSFVSVFSVKNCGFYLSEGFGAGQRALSLVQICCVFLVLEQSSTVYDHFVSGHFPILQKLWLVSASF